MDKEILYKAKNGDQDSLAMIFDEYSTRIFRYVYVRIHRRAVAEDLASTVFLKIVENIYKLDLNKNFEAWIFTITRNALIDLLRKNRFVSATEMVDYAQDERDQAAEVEIKLMVGEVTLAFKQLTDIEREIMELTYFAEMNDKEISKIIGKPAGNIRVIRFRAIKKLKTIIKHR